MPSNITVNIKCDRYLINYFESLHGAQPIVLPKRDPWSLFLDYHLRPAPANFKEPNYGNENLRIVLPYFEDKNVLTHFYLSELKQHLFIDALTRSFKVVFRQQIVKSVSLGLGCFVKDFIYSFMEDYNLPVDAYDMLARDYTRFRDNQTQVRLRKSKKL